MPVGRGVSELRRKRESRRVSEHRTVTHAIRDERCQADVPKMKETTHKNTCQYLVGKGRPAVFVIQNWRNRGGTELFWIPKKNS